MIKFQITVALLAISFSFSVFAAPAKLNDRDNEQRQEVHSLEQELQEMDAKFNENDKTTASPIKNYNVHSEFQSQKDHHKNIPKSATKLNPLTRKDHGDGDTKTGDRNVHVSPKTDQNYVAKSDKTHLAAKKENLPESGNDEQIVTENKKAEKTDIGDDGGDDIGQVHHHKTDERVLLGHKTYKELLADEIKILKKHPKVLLALVKDVLNGNADVDENKEDADHTVKSKVSQNQKSEDSAEKNHNISQNDTMPDSQHSIGKKFSGILKTKSMSATKQDSHEKHHQQDYEKQNFDLETINGKKIEPDEKEDNTEPIPLTDGKNDDAVWKNFEPLHKTLQKNGGGNHKDIGEDVDEDHESENEEHPPKAVEHINLDIEDELLQHANKSPVLKTKIKHKETLAQELQTLGKKPKIHSKGQILIRERKNGNKLPTM